MNPWKSLLPAMLLGMLMALSACAMMGPGEVDPDDDRSIQRAVQSEIRNAPVRGAGTVRVAVEEGVVTLTGSVPEPQAIGDIVMRVEGVPGVRRVITDVDFDGSDERRDMEPVNGG
ncbi:BON domain-containing protein [Gammaproteobacteria bacterium AB-CW1]|uniref:BON domain-containing protein n=1 Tax=Natronospira elongata TaxID=3110268 RepID=A0AAP6JH80_9GAMM|nr:BON domain-containing protein [Gammaproteobacteria bacterium AB-CW1]